MSTQKKGARKKVNKTVWIREQNPSMSAAEVVAKAKKAGITISVGQVYTARSTGRGKSAGASKKAASNSSSKHDAELIFVEAVSELGVAKAQRLLDALAKL